MDLKRLDFSLKTVFCLLVVFTVNAFGQTLCTVPDTVRVKENNTIGETVATLILEDGVSAVITGNPHEAFGINGNLLVAIIVLDFEALPIEVLFVELECRKEGVNSVPKRVTVIVENINDNPPVFAQSQYDLSVDELTQVGTSIGRIEATDLDKDQLFYWLESPMNEFGLLSAIIPQIQVQTILDYDTTQEVNMMLFVQDTPLSTSETPSHTASTSVKVSVLDINNRPPWFQPCTESAIGFTKVCLNSGYEGKVNLNEQVTGALILDPGPVHAIDGDKGRNEEIGYRILAGNENEIFSIDQNTGSITMQKAVAVAGSIILTVMAYEVLTPDQLATTTVTIHVVITSAHPPEFVKSSYKGFISEDVDVGSLVLESKTSNKPLHVQATDADFSDGVNPNIIFEVQGGSDFRITTEGFILMTSAAPVGVIDLTIRVVDSTNGEFGTASLSVEVTPGVPTTTTEMPTTTIPTTIITKDIVTSPPKTTGMITSPAKTTDMITSPAKTTDMITSPAKTTDVVTQLTESSSNPVITTNTTPSPQTALPGLGGDFKTRDMVALGASLAVVLLICLVLIGLLVYRLKQQNADWKKLSEASIFCSTLTGGSSGPKNGVQYTNEGFQNDRDVDSMSSKQAAELPLPLGPALSRSVPQQPEKQSSTPTLQSRTSDDSGSPPADSSSLSASDNFDSEKEVKPILTKERRVEDGYKAVWFKQDIDPNVKEEVVIIPDSGERDVSHDEEEEDDEEDTNVTMSTRRRGSDSDDDDL
ncbi:cadherin-related family member 5 isoform X2 [Pygocentrus nattereri]|uniref:cadherin-related family member 5 isoform X2 n=1 Tax=Pygocentrus nattereri TaxID=42514 RepID=UPI001891CAED|nr:cadherin-related family member 5 isoform X2 [Pygocentrus nattereri]